MVIFVVIFGRKRDVRKDFMKNKDTVWKRLCLSSPLRDALGATCLFRQAAFRKKMLIL